MPVKDKFDQARDKAEKRLICACIEDKAPFILATEKLSPENINSEMVRRIFSALIALDKQGEEFGPANLIDYMRRTPAVAIFDTNDIWRLGIEEGFISPAEAELNIELIARRCQQEKLMDTIHQKLTGLESRYAESVDELDECVAEIESKYREGKGDNNADLLEYQDCISQMWDGPKETRGLLCGYKELDRHVDLRPGQIMTIYGDTASKKTTLAMNFIARWAREKQVAVYNYEQKPKEIAKMVLDCDLRLEIPKGNLWISPDPPPIEALASQVRAIKLRRGLDGIVLDYIQTIPATTRNLAEDENNLVRFIMRSMRDLSQRESIWVVIIAQMRKSQADTMEHSLNPSLDKMRGSGEIKMASSIILSVVLPWKCGMRTIDGQTTENLMHVRIKKNRDCLTGNPGEEKEVRLIHQPGNRLITSLGF